AGKVEDVRVSSRLTDSPSCVTAEGGQIMTQQMRRMFEAAGQSVPEDKYILEVNPSHPLLVRAAAEIDEDRFAQWAELVLEQALLSEQGSLKDPAAFVRRVNELLLK
ncbi:MAG: molecular chaperone HtpG, partial [Duodenibacillus sp.]|nr:molecular chaperone HtpG [Duodenibacillus sp.]